MMEREQITKLIRSKDSGDCVIGLNFLRHYRYKDVKQILTEGKLKKDWYQIELWVNLKEYNGCYKLHHGLYMAIDCFVFQTINNPKSYITFSPLPFKGITLKKFLYD